MLKKITTLLLVAFLATNINSQTTIIHQADFEYNEDGWVSSGTNAFRLNSGAYSYSGNYCLNIRDNTTSSIYTSPSFNISNYDKVEISFFVNGYGLSNEHDFFLEYFDGVTWNRIEDFIQGVFYQNGSPRPYDFKNNLFSYKAEAIFASDYTFPANAQFRFVCDAGSTSNNVTIDKITIKGTVFNSITEAPGGETSNLELWLRADLINGSGVMSDGANVSEWIDNGKGNDARTAVSGQEPVYRNNVSNNVNFNPVVEFENNYNTAGRDLSYISARDELHATGGFYNRDIFAIVIPDPSISNSMYPLDTFTSRDSSETSYGEDVTGFGYGGFTQRLSGEYFTYCIGSSSETYSGSGIYNGYGKATNSSSIDYNQASIINIKSNLADTDAEILMNAKKIDNISNDIGDYKTISNSRFWIGRSQVFNGSFDGRIAEIITFSSRLSDTERAKVETYLAIKYGITLGGSYETNKNYVDANNNVIWNQSNNSGYNYDIAGIGRDDDSGLNQKQSKSVNTETDATGEIRGLLTIGLTDIYDTNSKNISDNSTTFNNGEFLVWGNNNGNLDNAPNIVNVDMSAGISGLSTPVTFTGMERVWKVVENGGDIPKVKLSIPKNCVRNISPPGSYLMFISDNGVFDPTADYRVMTDDGTNLTTEYDFDGTKYITFGYAPEVVVERSVYFDGTNDYIDMEDALNLNSSFTVSAWVKRGSSSANKSILSKRDASYTEGYDFKINSSGKVEMSWKNGSTQTISSNTTIPTNKWHHVAVIYNGSSAKLYIDGVLDKTTSMSSPITTSQSFYIGAAGKNSPTAFFQGNIDEVRVWDIALTENQLRYVMNQEIESNSSFVNGKVLPQSISKNEVVSIPWSQLAGYYPMSTYTFTNTNDESNNNNQGALRNLDTVDHQTAPLPYISNNTSTDWDSTSTWINGDENQLPGATSIVNSNITVDWNIVKISSNVTMDNSSLPSANNLNRTVLGLIIDNSQELTVTGTNPTTVDPSSGTGYGVTVSHYFELNGTIDLVGESQLIQTENSDIVIGTNGILERDQQGTENLYRYNQWSSPVYTNTLGGNNIAIQDAIKDGTNPDSPGTINFTSGYNGSTSPFTLSTYWMYKYADNPDGDYSSWEHVGSTGKIYSGEGFIMKGTNTSGSDEQNYVFQGKPNNGDITLNVSANYDYLVGNPYPSVLDADQFISDNFGTITGTLYYWEHYGGDTHNLSGYQAGYATYTLAGGTGTAATSPHTDTNQTLPSSPKTPGRYIPIAQGFFVVGNGTGGNIVFNNGQRTGFYTEGTPANSVFMKSSTAKNTVDARTSANTDLRPKFRIGFDAPGIDHRQILLTIDENTTEGVDWGYDGEIYDILNDDMYWLIEDKKYVIQATNEISEISEKPIGIKSDAGGLITIKIDELENVDDSIEIYLKDKISNETYNLRESNFEITLEANTDLMDKYSIVFKESTSLSVIDEELNEEIKVHMNNASSQIEVNNNSNFDINSIVLYNYLGQKIYNWSTNLNKNLLYLPIKSANEGVYFIQINTTKGKINKKILIK